MTHCDEDKNILKEKDKKHLVMDVLKTDNTLMDEWYVNQEDSRSSMRRFWADADYKGRKPLESLKTS